LKLKNELTEIKVSLEQKINELSLLEKSKKETEGNNSMLINKIIDFETKIKTKDAEIVDLNSEISNLSNLNESLKIEKESISKLCKNHEGIIVVEKNKFDELDSKLKILLEKSMADQNENLKLKGQIKDISLELEKKSKEIVALTEAKLEVERKVAFLENDLEKYKNILKEDTKTFELSQKMEEISNLGLQIEKLKGQYSLRSVMMDTLQQKFDKNTLELSELNSKYETLEKQLKDDQNVILGLKDSLVKAEMVKKEIEKMLDLEKLEKEKNMGMVSDLNQKLVSEKDLNSKLEEEKKSLEEKEKIANSKYEGDIVVYKKMVDDLKQKLGVAKESLESINTKYENEKKSWISFLTNSYKIFYFILFKIQFLRALQQYTLYYNFWKILRNVRKCIVTIHNLILLYTFRFYPQRN
jgi:chromosome segregation ATPase